jgi:hypothetical protein
VVDTALTDDHHVLRDEGRARRYFAKFDRITRLLMSVAAEMEREGSFSRTETSVIAGYISAISATFSALSTKYLIAGRLEGAFAKHLTIDLHESGFPIYQELATMANDAVQARAHLDGAQTEASLREEMVRVMLSQGRMPVAQQYAMSQRKYFAALQEGGLFWPQMHPHCSSPVGEAEGPRARRLYQIHWAVYDTQLNVPVIYLMEIEDSARTPLDRDAGRWASLQAHLLAQAAAGLKLLTIVKGIDADFEALHPKRLRRIHLGPMYSSAFTLQTGPIREVLDEAKSPAGEDWALAWTLEELASAGVEIEKGWFSKTERQVFSLDPLSGAETGTTKMTRSVILPQRAFQVLAEKAPQGFRDIRKYVVGREGRVIAYT